MRFYFHIRQGNQRYDDLVGLEVHDPLAAWEHAISDARVLVKKNTMGGSIDRLWIEIGDDTGAVVASMPFGRARQLH